ncbi:hypothetical protein WME76_39345 [Sorangium sp. So ce119]|uniref:hypothetical protein n=1 Tax=Sorangium sp. So ce119 TaxID=3133279 RepID=UPI003F62FA51
MCVAQQQLSCVRRLIFDVGAKTIVEEWLAIGISGRGSWIEKNPDASQCAGALKPRDKERRKSAWAYVEGSMVNPLLPIRLVLRVGRIGRWCGSIASEVFRRGNANATVELHALALLLFRLTGTPRSVPPSQVWVLLFKRSQVAPELIANEDNPHIVPAYDHTHRELDTANEHERLKLVRKLIAGRYRHAFDVRDFTLDELKPILKDLLTSNLIRDEYVAAAKAALGDFA